MSGGLFVFCRIFAVAGRPGRWLASVLTTPCGNLSELRNQRPVDDLGAAALRLNVGQTTSAPTNLMLAARILDNVNFCC